MPEFYSTTEVITLGRELGRGGEGAVFEVFDKPELVAKIYHEPISDEKAEKLRQMVALQNEKLLKLAAWVTDVLRDKPAGKVVGFLMPKISFGTPIHELYNPQSRRHHFPSADWRFLIHASANLARAFAVIHAHGHAVGDVNHGNVVIGRDATVRLIDCDSYHLNAPDKSYLCEVGVSTHTPPELQNHSLRTVVRTINHDAFGLAVLIFQLLFMGRHPFSGNFQGDGDNTLEDSIEHRRFAYGAGAAARQMKQPPGTLQLGAVSFEIANLFERAFLSIESRPMAREWSAALDELEQNLHQCTINTGHYYLQTLKKCPWCRLEGQTGVLFFPAKFTGNFESDGEFDLFTLGNLIDAIKPPDLAQNLPAVTQNLLTPTISLPPSSFVTEALVNYNTNLAVFLVITAILVFAVSYIFGFGSIFWMGFIGYWILSEIVKSILKVPQEDTQLKVDAARQNWASFKDDWRKTALAKPFETARDGLKAKIKEYRELPQHEKTKLKESEAKNYQQQLDFYLRSFPIKDAELFGLNDERLDLLTNSGIKTAAHVDNNTFPRTPQFTHSHKRILLEWRSGLEKKFVFKQSPKLSEESADKIENEIYARRCQLETELRGGLTGLQQISLQLTKRHQDLSLESDKFAADLSQAESDFKRVADLKSQAIVWMICVALMSFGIGVSIRQIIFFGNYSVPPPFVSDTIAQKEIGGSSGTGENIDRIYDARQTPPPAVQIDSSANWGKAREIYKSGEGYFNAGYYNEAVSAYKDAARANPKIAQIYNKMGEAYFQLAQFGKAVEAYQKALKIEPNDSDTWHKLGLVYKKINSLSDAINAFKKATENNLNADMSRYELGLLYAQVGDKQSAQKQYDQLDRMHSPFAEKLWNEIHVPTIYEASDAPPEPTVVKPIIKDSRY
ncbi:MAG: tetratricopeptide repeat protein [Pyrinomonadaceae bacterium]